MKADILILLLNIYCVSGAYLFMRKVPVFDKLPIT